MLLRVSVNNDTSDVLNLGTCCTVYVDNFFRFCKVVVFRFVRFFERLHGCNSENWYHNVPAAVVKLGNFQNIPEVGRKMEIELQLDLTDD